MRQPIGKLIARRRVGNARRDAEHPSQEFTPAVVARQVVLGRRAIEQELEIRPRPLELGDKRVAPLLLDERVGIFAARQLDYVDVEAFAYQQLRAALGGGLAGAVGVVAEHGLRGEASQHLCLLRRQRRAAGRNHRKAARLVHLREVEIALDDQREVAFAQVALRQVEAVERAALRIDRRLGRVQVFRLLIGFERAAAEGDHRAGVARDRNHQAIAKPIDLAAIVAARDQAARSRAAAGVKPAFSRR